MKTVFSNLTLSLIALILITSVSSKSCASSESDPAVVAEVDLNRYTGLWYEIAHAPNFFQRDCLRSTAEYQIVSQDSVSVHNICYKAEGEVSDIKGTAKVVDPAVPAKLKVRFNFFARGDYWITELDPEYQWAVVSAPAKKSLFILARKAPMDKALLNSILTTLKSKGFNTEELIFDQY